MHFKQWGAPFLQTANYKLLTETHISFKGNNSYFHCFEQCVRVMYILLMNITYNV